MFFVDYSARRAEKLDCLNAKMPPLGRHFYFLDLSHHYAQTGTTAAESPAAGSALAVRAAASSAGAVAFPA
jgi:hypothetical protein